MSYDISDMSDMPKWRRGAVGLSRHVILSSDMSDISDISEMSDMSDIPYTQHTYRHPPILLFQDPTYRICPLISRPNLQNMHWHMI